MTDLNALAAKYRSDKAPGGHNYTSLYSKYFEGLRNEAVNIVEIGIGDHGGDSLRLWQEYFVNAQHIVGLDRNEEFIAKARSIGGNISASRLIQGDYDTTRCCQTHLNRLCEDRGIDIIIDDGSHDNNHIIHSFKAFWPLLRNGGIYVVEDTYSSWLSPDTSATNVLLDTLLPQINDHVSGQKNELGVCSIHVYREIIFILKGESVTK